MKYLRLLFYLFVGICLSFALGYSTVSLVNKPRIHQWDFQSIDTMKYSRDLAREKISDKVIDQQMAAIAKTGATHVAIGTPYDDEFLPVLNRWVESARKYNLKVWFRGNLSGWEQWFDYKTMSRLQHTFLTEQFILKNNNLFEDGDIFTSCPKCENGTEINFSDQQEIISYRAFLVNEHEVTQRSFKKIKKNVTVNYYSMNYEVAKVIMDRDTVIDLNNIIVIDYYSLSPEQLQTNINTLAQKTGAKIIVDQVGVPSSEIQGQMTEEEQKQWIQEVFVILSQLPNVKGVNYTDKISDQNPLWDEDGQPRSVVGVLTNFYSGKEASL